MSKLIFGCGYLGSRVAQLWRESGETVYAVTRSESRSEAFRAAGLLPIVADITGPETLRALPAVDAVLVAVGFDRSVGATIHDVYVTGLANALDALPASVAQIIYVSSVGVYGQTDGGWVDEQSPCEPTQEGGRACLAAESLLAEHAPGTRRVVLRLAGIYGPDRIPLAAKIQAGEAIPNPPDGWLNLIHVDDAARIVLAADQNDQASGVYCVADGNPVLRRDYYDHLAELLAAPPPTYCTESPPGERRRGGGNKRIRIDRLRRDLAPQLQYPSYRQGLAAIVGEMGNDLGRK
jgi:nucleoside-diphosphate-sugar epimerase